LNEFFLHQVLEKDGGRGYKRGTKNMKLSSTSRAFENFYKIGKKKKEKSFFVFFFPSKVKHR